MCFSAEADLVMGVVITATGIDAVRHLERPRDAAMASLPIVFGVHQIVEGFGWLGLDGRLPSSVGRTASWAYLFVAFAVVPILVPTAQLLFEQDPRRRRSIVPFVGAGVVVALVLTRAIITGPVQAEIAGRYIAYRALDLDHGGEWAVIYVVATCAPLLLSSSRRIRIFGAANLVVVSLLTALLVQGVISLWCAWAAVGSVAIASHFRVAHTTAATARAASSTAPEATRSSADRRSGDR
jgi:hypothetical protein